MLYFTFVRHAMMIMWNTTRINLDVDVLTHLSIIWTGNGHYITEENDCRKFSKNRKTVADTVKSFKEIGRASIL